MVSEFLTIQYIRVKWRETVLPWPSEFSHFNSRNQILTIYNIKFTKEMLMANISVKKLHLN